MEKVGESAQHTNLCIIYGLKEAWTPINKEKLIESLGTATEFNCYSHLTVQECRGRGAWDFKILLLRTEAWASFFWVAALLALRWRQYISSGSSGELTGRNEYMGFEVATKACWGTLCEGHLSNSQIACHRMVTLPILGHAASNKRHTS